LPDVTIKSLLEAGVHFGHRTRKWNPKMKRFIFEERNGIHILDLQKTLSQVKKVGQVLRDVVLRGGSVLFVGTKKQGKETIYRSATRCGMYYVNERWLGGTLTNYATIRKSIGRLRELETMSEDGMFERLPKKEVAHLLREKAKLHKYLDGIKDMTDLPSAMFVVDTRREKIAIAEARKIGIPVIAMVDSTADPDVIDYPIAANDDAIKSIFLISNLVADYIVEVQNELYKSQPEPVSPKRKTASHGRAHGNVSAAAPPRAPKTGDVAAPKPAPKPSSVAQAAPIEGASESTLPSSQQPESSPESSEIPNAQRRSETDPQPNQEQKDL
jgi:small subunit ribosomal protein S2